MILNYSRPQTEIFQILETTANPLLDRIHAVVVGPAYIHADLSADNLVYDTYQQDTGYSYRMLRDGESVAKGTELIDGDSVSLVAKNLRLVLFDEDAARFVAQPGNLTGNVLETISSDGFLNTADPSVAAAFDYGRPPTIGDIYHISDGSSEIERKVTGIAGKDLDSGVTYASYFGAEAFDLSVANDDVVTVSSANFSYTAVKPWVTDGASTSAGSRYIRRYGKAGLGQGLRLAISVICDTGTGVPSTSSFTAAINGVPTSVTAAVSATTGTLFTLGDITFRVTGYNAWQTGDRISLTIDYTDETVILPVPQLFGSADQHVESSGYTYSSSTRRLASNLTIEVTAISDTDATTFRIYDAAGLMTPAVATVANGGNLDQTIDYDGGEISVSLTAIDKLNFHVGQKFVYLISPPSRSTTVFDKVLLNAPLGTALNTGSPWLITAYRNYSGVVPAVEPTLFNVNFTVGADEVAVGTIQARVSGYTNASESVRPALDSTGTVAVQWRAVINTGDSDGLVPIDSVSDIITQFGSIGLASELGYGLYKAFGGAGGKRVYGLNTGGAAYADFLNAFEKLESANYIYTVAVLSSDLAVGQLAASHCRTLSLPSVKRFRRAYVGTDSPGEYPILDVQADSSPYTASIQAGTGGLYTLVVFENDITFGAYSFSRGDFLEVTGTGARYLIDTVDEIPLAGGGTTIAVTLQAGPSVPVSSTPVRVIAADTAENTARYVWQRSAALGSGAEEDRRIANIWQDKGTLLGVTIPNRFGACEMAGLRTALQPQQGLTRTEVSFIDSAPSMYTKFRQSVLDEMAARGVWIITQNSADTPCYVRHQLTTAVSNGSLYYEDNAGTNIDTVCFALDDLIDPLIGKRNATPRTVLEIRGLVSSLLTQLTKEPYDAVLGPQLISFFNSNGDTDSMDIAIDPNFKDRINLVVGIEIPLPLNNIRIFVKARTIKNDGLVVNAVTVTPA